MTTNTAETEPKVIARHYEIDNAYGIARPNDRDLLDCYVNNLILNATTEAEAFEEITALQEKHDAVARRIIEARGLSETELQYVPQYVYRVIEWVLMDDGDIYRYNVSFSDRR